MFLRRLLYSTRSLIQSTKSISFHIPIKSMLGVVLSPLYKVMVFKPNSNWKKRTMLAIVNYPVKFDETSLCCKHSMLIFELFLRYHENHPRDIDIPIE